MRGIFDIPEPDGVGTFDAESFSSYFKRWPIRYAQVPSLVVETWVHRHWRDFQCWLPLHPLDWAYELRQMTFLEVLTIGHVNDWPKTLQYWGDDLIQGRKRRETWLGRTMLSMGTTPTPMIVAANAGLYRHPRERNHPFVEPFQLVEGHMRLAYLQGMIRHKHPQLRELHDVFVATLPAESRDCATSRLNE
jgi:hypothetical protein